MMPRLYTGRCRRLGRAGLVLMILAALTVLGQVPAQAGQKATASTPLPTIRWPGMVGFASWFPSLDPTQVVDGTSMQTIYKINGTLLHLLPGARYAPGMATMKVSKNHLVYTLTLRKGLRFSNGDPLTATDVVFSLRRFLAPSTASPTAMTSYSIIEGAADYNAGKTDLLPGVVKINSLTIQIRTTEVNSTFPLSFAIYAGVVLDHKVLAGKIASATNNYLTNTCGGNVGAGPFKPVCRNTDSSLDSFFPSGSTPTMTLVPNPFYYGKKPHLKLVMQGIKDNQTAYLQYQANGLDATSIPSADIAQNQGKKNFFHFPSTLVWYLSPSVDLSPFDNVHCRLALAYAINTDEINKTVLHGAQSTIHVMVPKGLTGYYSGKGDPSYNPTKAKAELAQCPGGVKGVKLVYAATGSDNDLVYGGAIPAMLQAVGMDVKGVGVPAATWLKLATQPQKNTQTPLLESGLGASGPAIVCKARTSGYLLNSANWSNPTYDALCAKALKTFNRTKLAKVYQQAQHIALNAGVWIPIGQTQNFAIAKPWIHGLMGDPYYSVLIPKNYDWSNVTVSAH